MLKGHEERPSEVVSMTDGHDALDSCGDGSVPRSTVPAPTGQTCLLHMFDVSFLKRGFGADCCTRLNVLGGKEFALFALEPVRELCCVPNGYDLGTHERIVNASRALTVRGLFARNFLTQRPGRE